MYNSILHINLKENAEPKYCKARLVPYAIKDILDKELDRLVRQDIYKPVEISEWAAPIVPVMKKDGSIRICGDYKKSLSTKNVFVIITPFRKRKTCSPLFMAEKNSPN